MAANYDLQYWRAILGQSSYFVHLLRDDDLAFKIVFSPEPTSPRITSPPLIPMPYWKGRTLGFGKPSV
jgi:hypothetical protein